MVEDGWTAEMAIPFKSLRYPALAGEGGRRWGFQITRVIRGKSEAQSWSPISRGVAGQLTQFGVLEGLSDLSQQPQSGDPAGADRRAARRARHVQRGVRQRRIRSATSG